MNGFWTYQVPEKQKGNSPLMASRNLALENSAIIGLTQKKGEVSNR